MKNAHNKLGDVLLGSSVSDYLNRADVRTALNIPTSTQVWETCNSKTLKYTVGTKGSIWIYPILKAANLKLLFYSGDTDGAVTTYGTRQWIKNSLKWDIKTATTPWFVDNQFEGEVTRYEGLDFATVHGVGHMSPQWKRF